MNDYDATNPFARILKGEIPAETVYEDAYALAFRDMHPAARVHVLVIPKGEYCSFHDFTANAGAETVAGFFRAVRAVALQEGVKESGYRLITNHGADASQTVPHFHIHLLGGQPLGGLLTDDLHKR